MKKLIALLFAVLMVVGCATNSLTGKRTMALVDNSELFSASFEQYEQFISENTVITGTAEANMVVRVGKRLSEAARKWLAAEGDIHVLDGYEWEFNLVQDDSVNAWCMPGGKIVFYTGILPITKTEAGMAVVMGHEISHALLNHGQQRMSADVLQQLGAAGLSVMTSSDLALTAYGVGSQVFGTLPFSRKHESEADHYGLLLMSIAGYNPDEAVPFWERMSAGGGSVPELLSTHPSDETRIKQLRSWVPEAKQKAAEFGVQF